MKNKALRILVSIASVVAVVGSLYFIFYSLLSLIASINEISRIMQFITEAPTNYIARIAVLFVVRLIFCLSCLCIPVCGVLTFMYVNSFLTNGNIEKYEMEKAQVEKERKKQLLEKLKSELGEE